ALGTAARGLALGPVTTTDAGLGGLGTGGRAQVVDLNTHNGSLRFCNIAWYFFDHQQVRGSLDVSADQRGVLYEHTVVDPLETERPQRLALVVLGPDGGLDLGDLEHR